MSSADLLFSMQKVNDFKDFNFYSFMNPVLNRIFIQIYCDIMTDGVFFCARLMIQAPN